MKLKLLIKDNVMKHFMIEGIITNTNLINDVIMKVHMEYSKKAMDIGLILMSSLKADMSGGLFIMMADDIKDIELYLSNEPFKVNGIQEYKIKEFNIHYISNDLVNSLE